MASMIKGGSPRASVRLLIINEDIMPKSSAKLATAPAQLRLIIMDVVAPDGDLSQAMQAAQSALRPADVAVIRRAIAAPYKVASSGEIVDAAPAEENAEIKLEEQTSTPCTSSSPSGSRNRPKPRSPKVIHLELKSGDVPFAAFAQSKKPTTHAARNLVVAAWFKLHRAIDAVTMDHVYTCYRAVEWPSGMEDFSLTLRQLKRRKLMDSKGVGEYAINHIGMSNVDKMAVK